MNSYLFLLICVVAACSAKEERRHSQEFGADFGLPRDVAKEVVKHERVGEETHRKKEETSDKKATWKEEPSDKKATSKEETSDNKVKPKEETSDKKATSKEETSDKKATSKEETSDKKATSKEETSDNKVKPKEENALLLGFKSEQLLFAKMVDFFLNNPNTKEERECFAKFKPGQSVDFVIDLAASPSLDEVDRMLAEESPVALYLQRHHRSASMAYRQAVEVFIEKVSYDIKPELTHSVILENGKKLFIRGEAIESEKENSGEFEDKSRNLHTLWPVRTKSFPETFLSKIIKNNLGRTTRLVLANRDNGVPSVLRSSRHSKPVYTIVVTDGSSGAKIEQLTDDLSRTTVIDIGNHRFVKRLSWDELKKLASFYTLTAPQQLILLADTIRMTTCCFAKEISE